MFRPKGRDGPTSAVQPPSAQTGEGKALLATKVVVPRLPPDLLFHPGLLQALTEATKRVLVLVCTPAGFGKTSLLASWVRSSRRPAAWLSLDHGDNDPVRSGATWPPPSNGGRTS